MTEGETKKNRTGLEVAVIGMAGRFPGAKNCAEFWENIKNGVESIRFFSDEELEKSGVTPDLYKKDNYVKARGILDDVEYFDSGFFGYTPLEAEVMDPQLKVFHECAWEALEDAGYDPYSHDGLIGIYAGASSSFSWELLSLLSGKGQELGGFTVGNLVDKDFLSSRVAYKLNLKGPVHVVQTACSTSLVAIHQASRGVLSGECNIALAGGVTIKIPRERGYIYQDLMISSPDGHCRAFDAKAQGTVGSSGAAIVVLKRLKNALRDGDHIYAVIKGSAVNNDGNRKVGFTAPSIYGQAEVIRAALVMARVEPETITYIEAHGTGTALGDPIEVEALKMAFNTAKKNYCGLGSVKTNMGHLDSAAGAAGFIKTVLALKHRLIPPSLHFNTSNPKIDFENSPFYVNTAPTGWKNSEYPLRAGVSSFGIGGTNAHVVLEEAPVRGAGAAASSPGDYRLILLSANTQTALDKITANLVEYFKKNPGINLADAAYTLQVGRSPRQYRRISAAANIGEALEELSSLQPGKVKTSLAKETERTVVFMFPGQGSQYVNMGLELYRTEPLFREEINRCFEILEPLMGYDVKEVLYPAPVSDNTPRPARDIDRTEVAQPLIFTFEYALAKLLMSWGIQPSAMIGHSIGEYTAACLAGVFSLEHALELVSIRGKLVQKLPPGAMLSVPLPAAEVEKQLNGEVSLAAINSTSRCVVSGTFAAIETLEKTLREKGCETTRLHTSHAFHSRMMEPMLKEFSARVKEIPLKEPGIPYISNLSGQWISAGEVVNPAYWVRHLRETVRFSRGLEVLLTDSPSVFVEVGPGKVLSTFVTTHESKGDQHAAANLIRHPGEKVSDIRCLLSKIGQLWLWGAKIDWQAFNAREQRNRLPLPTYPFEGRYYPVSGDPLKIGAEMLSRELLPVKRKRIADWFYVPSWQRRPLLPGQAGENTAASGCLVFANDSESIKRLVEKMKQKDRHLATVTAGDTFAEDEHDGYRINPADSGDYDRLFSELNQLHRIPGTIIHCWNVTENENPGVGAEDLEASQDLGFCSLLYTAQAIARQDIKGKIRIHVFTDNTQEVTGEEAICPGKSTILAPVKIIPREYVNISCKCIDITWPETENQREQLLNRLLVEIHTEPVDTVIAYRGGHRWVQNFIPLSLEKSPVLSPRLKEKGVYLITGGLGGIGFVLAEYLARTYQAKLILTGRSELPPREEWQRAENLEDPAIQKLRKLEELGVDFLVFSADAADSNQMQHVVTTAAARFGEINGVIHSAGIPGGGVIQQQTRESVEAVFAPKVQGMLVLDRVLKNRMITPDFIFLCSSLNSILSAFGTVCYCAANIFLDAYAHYKSLNEGVFTISVDWDGWKEVGMAKEAYGTDSPEILKDAILSSEGIEVFLRVLARNQPQFAVSTGDLNILLQKQEELTAAPNKPASAEAEVSYTRPELSAEYAPPRDILEEKLAEIWQEFFGLDNVGIHDDFFELGGDSLLGMRLVNRYQELFREIIYINMIFEAPTISKQAAYLKNVYPESVLRLTGGDMEREAGFSLSGIPTAKIQRIRNQIPRMPDFFDQGSRNPPAIFILSPPRSGSTLLRVILAGHEKLFAPPELNLLFSNLLIENRNANQASVRAIMQIKGCGVEEAKDLLREYEDRRMPVKEFYRLLQEWIGDRVLVDKSPLYSLYPEVLQRTESIFENAFYIHLLRHPYGMIRSLEEAKTDLLAGSDFLARLSLSRREYAEISWVIQHKNILEFLENIPQNRQFRLKFEELVQHPRAAVENICHFLGLDFREKMLEPYKDKEEKMTDGIHREGVMMGDPKFHRHNRIDEAVAHAWKAYYKTDFLGELARGLAKSFGYKLLAKTGTPKPTIEPGEEKEYYPLASPQKSLYIYQQMHRESTGYNIIQSKVLEGQAAVEKLTGIFRKLISRHESLRTSFLTVKGKPFQKIQNYVPFEIEQHEASEHQANEIIKDFVKPFELGNAPLLRVGLIKISADRYILIMDVHHIIMDGTSLEIFGNDFDALYRDKELTAPHLQYRDYAEWQNHPRQKEALKQQEEYWLKEFAGEVPVLNLPTDYDRPDIQSFEGIRLTFELSGKETEELKTLSATAGSTMFMVLLALFNVFLSKICGQEDIVVGTPLGGRRSTELENIIGMFINTLALRNFPAANKTFHEFLKEVRTRTIKAFANQDYQFQDLVNQVVKKRDASRNPLFDVVFAHHGPGSQAKGTTPANKGELKGETYRYERETSKRDLTFMAHETSENLYFTVEYCIKLFNKKTVENFIKYFKEIVSAVLKDKDVHLGDIRIAHDFFDRKLNNPGVEFDF